MLAMAYSASWPWHKVVLYRTPMAWLTASLLFATAVVIYSRSRLSLGRSGLGRRGEALPERRLVTDGIRQYVRHPIYLAHLCMLLAWTVGSGEVVLYAFTVFKLVTGWPMIRQEEAELEHCFGEEYRSYRRSVPAAVLPRVLPWGRKGTGVREAP
jgi:protein-S-isoprenylcysteine O-methyltransferase Ste14